jgi:hypothetical protein
MRVGRTLSARLVVAILAIVRSHRGSVAQITPLPERPT